MDVAKMRVSVMTVREFFLLELELSLVSLFFSVLSFTKFIIMKKSKYVKLVDIKILDYV